jgi:prolyl 4-hydroxylase
MSSRAATDPYALYRMQIGTWLRDRLQSRPGVFQLPAQGLDLFVVRDFLPKPACDKLIALIDADRVPSGILATYEPDPEFRTSESCNMSPAHPAVRDVEERITALMGIDPVQGETIQGQRYAVGQQFKPHHDFFHTDQDYWAEMQRTGGQRTWTAMIFLNEPEAGGHTAFPRAGVKVTPRTGNMLVWNNMDAFGMPNEQSLHTGTAVEAGVKYVITKWYRERPWGSPAAA